MAFMLLFLFQDCLIFLKIMGNIKKIILQTPCAGRVIRRNHNEKT